MLVVERLPGGPAFRRWAGHLAPVLVAPQATVGEAAHELLQHVHLVRARAAAASGAGGGGCARRVDRWRRA